MPTIHETKFRHSRHFLETLRSLAGDGPTELSLQQRLADLRADWDQISTAQAWTAENFEDEHSVAELCSHFGYFGTDGCGQAVRDFLQSPSQRLEWLKGALASAGAMDDKRAEAVHYTHLGMTHFENGQFEPALEAYNAAESMFTELDDARSQAVVWDHLGMVFRARRDPETALSYFSLAREVHQQLGSPIEESRSLTWLADCAADVSDHDRQASFLEEALRIQHEINDVQAASRTMAGLAITYSRLGRHERAVELCDAARDSLESAGPPTPESFGSPFSRLGRSYLQIGEADRALDCLLRDLHVQQSADNHIGTGMVLLNLMVLHVETKPRMAIEYAEQAVQTLEKAGYAFGLGIAHRALALATWRIDPRRAQGELEQAIELLRDCKSQVELGKSLRDLARLLHESGHHGDALSAAKEAFGVLDPTDKSTAAKVRVLIQKWQEEIAT